MKRGRRGEVEAPLHVYAQLRTPLQRGATGLACSPSGIRRWRQSARQRSVSASRPSVVPLIKSACSAPLPLDSTDRSPGILCHRGSRRRRPALRDISAPTRSAFHAELGRTRGNRPPSHAAERRSNSHAGSRSPGGRGGSENQRAAASMEPSRPCSTPTRPVALSDHASLRRLGDRLSAEGSFG